MQTTNALPMLEAKNRLTTKNYRLDDLDGHMAEFGKALAGYLTENMVPGAFVMACDQTLRDLRIGKKPQFTMLAWRAPPVYKAIRARIPELAAAIFPADYAEKVKEFLAGVN